VFQQRSEPHDSLDDFPTPCWATRALCEWLATEGYGDGLSELTCREPAANRGHMVKPLSEYFGEVIASDIHDYGAGYEQRDYLFYPPPDPCDFTITNPPFRLAEQFLELMLETSRVGCAVILRSAFLEGIGRFDRMFSQRPPSFVLQHVERVPMVKGRLDKSASSATAYAWLVWLHGESDTRLRWIPPFRKRLERASDYEAAA